MMRVGSFGASPCAFKDQKPGISMIIGIDLGTTNSLAAVWRDGETVLIPNALGSVMTPSVVSRTDDGQILVGMAARERLATAPQNSVAAFKRYMGTARTFSLGGSEKFRAEELSSFILRSLKADAEAFLGTPVTEAIITVPAYFNDAQRKATKAAGQLAGLTVDRLLNEPTAAALCYGLQEQQDDERRVMVLDLGGGTFDVSILEMFDGVMEVRSTAGDNFLGGEDFAELIAENFITALGAAHGIPPLSHPSPVHGLLLRQAEVAKRALSERDQHILELQHAGETLRWTLTRSDFETFAEPLVRRVRAPIERALRDAKFLPDQISHLVLAGGATRMPIFRKMAARLFQRFPITTVNPDEVVGRGAAVQAGLKMRDAALDDVVMTDVAPFSMGIEVAQRSGGKVAQTGLFSPIIERNSIIPISRSDSYCTIQDNQASVNIRIFQGESRLVTDNVFLGELTFPMPPAPAGQSFDVRFTYDISGILEVRATNPETGLVRDLVIEGNPGILSPAEIAERLRALDHLKHHPREQAENQAVMARANRLYEETLGDLRAHLGQLIGEFEQVLDQQDPHKIREFRAEFTAWLDRADITFFQ